MESGEILESPLDSTRSSHNDLRNPNTAHNPSYEWPWDSPSLESFEPQDLGESREASTPTSPSPHAPVPNPVPVRSCRFVVFRTRILPKLYHVAVFDGFEQVQIGRDAAAGLVPKIRLKEMEVSKLHATVYWDQSWNRWAVVDMGSKHGTFVQPAFGESSDSETSATRLSAPRAASVPKRLDHLDRITIGSTTFVVHIHPDGLPCVECSPRHAENEIPLFSTAKSRPSRESSADTIASPSRQTISSKTALSQLRRNLMTRHDTSPYPKTAATAYIDRSALRRSRHPSSSVDSPGIPSCASTPSDASPSTPISLSAANVPNIPLSSSNVGHMLLVKQGWIPGTSLGSINDGRVDPLDLAVRNDRAGLGSTESFKRFRYKPD